MESKHSIGFKHIFRALRYRNYRLFFTGQSISLIGTWMQQMAVGWLVYRLTHSALMLGLVGFLSQIPTLFLTPIAGVFADRHNRHHILLVTQVLAMIQALILALLVITGHIGIWHIIALSIFLGLINAFDGPVRHSFVVEMVEEKEDLGNAIALNSLIFNGARLIGPSIAGILVGIFGEGPCFLINSVSYCAVILALLDMKLTPRKIGAPAAHIIHELKEGFRYAFSFTPIRSILILLALVSLMGMPYVILMPVFARDILHGGPYTLGFLMGSAGLGALIGALYLASRKSIEGLGRIIVLTTNIFGIGIIGFSFSRALWLSLTMLLFAGFGMMVQMASANTVLQTIVDDSKRGRVMSLFMTAFLGMVPFGSLLAGGLAHAIGATYTLAFCGLSCIIGSFVFGTRLSSLKKMTIDYTLEWPLFPK